MKNGRQDRIAETLTSRVHGFALPLLALPYYFFDEKMEFLGQSPFQRKEKRPCGMK